MCSFDQALQECRQKRPDWPDSLLLDDLLSKAPEQVLEAFIAKCLETVLELAPEHARLLESFPGPDRSYQEVLVWAALQEDDALWFVMAFQRSRHPDRAKAAECTARATRFLWEKVTGTDDHSEAQLELLREIWKEK